MSDATTSEGTKVTVGLDLGDRHIQVCVLDEAGEVIEEARLATKPQALRRRFSGADPLRIVLEAGAHSPLSEPPARGARARGARGQPPQAAPDLPERLEVRPRRRRVPRPGGSPRPGAACSPAAPRRRDPGRSRPPAQPQRARADAYPPHQPRPRDHEVAGWSPARLLGRQLRRQGRGLGPRRAAARPGPRARRHRRALRGDPRPGARATGGGANRLPPPCRLAVRSKSPPSRLTTLYET